MPNITTCPRCGALYEEKCEEEANAPTRLCRECFRIVSGRRLDRGGDE